MGVTYSLLNQYRIYDEAVRDFIKGFAVDYGEIAGRKMPRQPILAIMSSPERAFAKMYQILVRKGWIEEPTKERTLELAELYKNVPLPMISFVRREATIDMSRSNAPFIFDAFEYIDDAGIDHPHPVPYDITYEFVFWCKKRYTANWFEEWMEALVGYRGSAPQEIFLRIPLGVWGTQSHGFRFEGMYETSNHMGLLYGFRDYAYTATFILRGWVFKYPEYQTGEHGKMFLQQFHDYERVDLSQLPPAAFKMHTTVGTRNLVEQISPRYNYDALFDTKDADVTLSDDCMNNRYNFMSPYVPGTPPAYKFTFNAVDAYVRTKRFILPPDKATIAIRFAHKHVAGSTGYFKVLDREGNTVRQIDIPVSPDWQTRQEIFVKMNRNMFLEWEADSDEIILDGFEVYVREGLVGTIEYIIDSDMSDPGVGAWTALGGAVLSKVVYGVQPALRVDTTNIGDGVSQQVTIPRMGIYLLTVDVYEATADYRLTFTNGTDVSTFIIKPLVDKTIGLVLFTQQNLEIKVEQVVGNGHIILDNIQVRSFKGAPLLQV